MNTRDSVVTVIGMVITAVLLLSMGSCVYNYNLDNRDRKQQKIEQCIKNGYGGMIELNDGRSFICTGGGTPQK